MQAYNLEWEVESCRITSYNVCYTKLLRAIDAVEAGYKVTVIEGLSKGVAPESTAKALEEMKARGITIMQDAEIWDKGAIWQ